MNQRKNRRKDKNLANFLLRKCKVGQFVEDCRGHPCVVTKQEFYPSDMYGWGFKCESLVDGTPMACSLMHCGPVPLTRGEAYAQAEKMNLQKTET